MQIEIKLSPDPQSNVQVLVSRPSEQWDLDIVSKLRILVIRVGQFPIGRENGEHGQRGGHERKMMAKM